MTWLSRWMRIVGLFYVGLGLFNTPPVIEARMNTQYPNLGVPLEANAAQVLVDVWFMFGLETLVIGIGLILFASRPERHLSLVWVVLGLELFRGVVVDIYFIARGYDPIIYIGWIVIHVAIIATGYLAISRLRRESYYQTHSAEVRG